MEIIKNIKKNTIILIGMTIIILYIVLKDDFFNILNDLKNMDFRFLLLAFLFYFLYIVLHAYVVFLTVNKRDKFSFMESIKHNIIVQFFNGITPFSTGGQPMEIYMLTEHGISGVKATNYILQNFIFYQIALVLFGIFAVMINFCFKMFPYVNILREFVIIGFIINTLVAVFLLFISFSLKFGNRVINLGINILYKMHLITDKEKQKKIWEERVQEFHSCAKELKVRKGLFVQGVLFNFIGLACLYVIPLFIVYAFHDFKSLNALSAITSSAYVMVVGSFVPIPGASGGIEYGFTQFFGNFISGSFLKSVLLIWRFITYYAFMVLGSIIFNIHNKEVK